MMKFLITLTNLMLLNLVITLPKATSDGSYGDYDHSPSTSTSGVLGFDVYKDVCPEVEAITLSWVQSAVTEDSRMAASLLRLHFHDCFGCDGSVLLDDTDFFVGEKTAAPNLNSLRGFEVIDAIKSELETFCPETVSCADILAIAARDSVLLSGGPSWEVEIGRRDSLSASKTAANNNIPGPNSTFTQLLSKFKNVGLDLKDLVALSGAHTMGKARCSTFSARLRGSSATSPPAFIQSLQQLCSESIDGGGGNTLAELDLVTPSTFDNQYYVNLVSGQGLLPSDQVLVMGDDQARDIVTTYAQDPFVFFADFQSSMLKMGSIGVLIGTSGEIRRDCRRVNKK